MNLKAPLSFLIHKLFQPTMTSSSTPPAYNSNYERMTGNCTRLIATEIISTISPPITTTSYILDSACGTGIVSEQIKLQHPSAKIMATDLAPKMIEGLQQRIKAEGWSNMQTATLDSRALTSQLPADSFTHVISNLGLPVPGDAGSGLAIAREIFRLLQPGGVTVLSTWAGLLSLLFSVLVE